MCWIYRWKVTERLLDENVNVVGVDSLNDYYDPRLKEWRLKQLKVKSEELRVRNQKSEIRNQKFNFHLCDISSIDAVRTVFANYKFDAVINLAARAGVRASVENPWVYLAM